MISYLLPTRDRHDRLRETLAALALLEPDEHERLGAGGGEVLVIDNASREPVRVERSLSNGFEVRILRRDVNEGAAARNIGAQEARGEWLVMLDDDSFPIDCGHLEVLSSAADDVAAIGAEILLSNGQREAGGLPEVIIGCGAAIRRDAFLAVGGYDPTFDYYAEEYDLCAKLIVDGWRIVHDFRFRVRHEKVAAGREMNRILHRLVRNNCWVMQQYAPDDLCQQHLLETISRYGQIALKESAAAGFAVGVAEVLAKARSSSHGPMSRALFDRFTGVAHVREALCQQLRSGMHVAIVDRGKNARVIEQVLNEIGIVMVEPENAEALIIGSLSPGPMLDAFERLAGCPRRVIMPWQPLGLPKSMAEFAAA
jgi:GT2 family glycosyltransferase